MDKDHLSDKKKLLIAFSVLSAIYVLLVLVTYHECRELAVSEAEKNLEGFLLSHRAIRSFVEDVQKEEIYRLKREHLLYEEYFSPQLLSSTYVARGIKDAQNSQLNKKGQDELYLKFASGNPRNRVNRADRDELVLLQQFNSGSLTEYKAVIDTPSGKSLYYALPVAKNRESCMNCHGSPTVAPGELLDRYGDKAGFYEDIGEIRALMSVRVPLAGLMEEADRTAFGLSIVSLLLFSGIFWLVYLHLRKVASQEVIRERLRKAEKMESIGLMAGGVAHDLNNILAGIINYPELMLRKLPADSDMRKQLEAVQQSGVRAAAVVADLLTVARGVATRKEIYDLNRLVRELLDSPEFEKLQADWPHIEFTASLSALDVPISCSSIHVNKSLLNLLTNAFEASRNECWLATGVRYFDSERAKAYNAAAGDYCFVRVADSGAGISAEDLQHIFEPFYSTKKMGKSGTGLGLSVVWNTVKDHNGIVVVDSDHNGSTFSLYFPLEQSCGQIPDQKPTDVCQGGHGEKILVVDDEAHLCDIAVSILRELDYAAHSVTSGEAALEYLSNHPVDLVLLDMLMEPGMNGLETYKKIIALYPGQKAVIASGFSASDDVKASLQLGAGGFIKKPYSSSELGILVRAVLTKQ